MVHYSVLVPQRDAGEAFARQLPELCRVFDKLVLPYEIICIDDGSSDATLDLLDALRTQLPQLRVLRFDEPRGVSAALTAGIEASDGDIIIAVEAGMQYAPNQIPHLIARLSRGDLVYGRRPSSMLAKAWQRVSRIPRWLLLGLEVKDPDCLFWAARREAVVGVQMARGMFRYLPSIVAMRGFRVAEVIVDFQHQPRSAADARPNPADLLTIWWLKRRWRLHTAHELVAPRRTRRPNVLAITHEPYRRESA